MQSIISAGANQFVQRAAVVALKGPRDDVEKMRLQYKARRDLVLAGLRSIDGVKIADIPATFYAFPDVSSFMGKRAGNHVIENTDQLCDWLLETHGLAIVPGTAFGAPGSVRLSFAASEDDIKKALHRIAQGLQSLV
jgi:aspartate aminotransferase